MYAVSGLWNGRGTNQERTEENDASQESYRDLCPTYLHPSIYLSIYMKYPTSESSLLHVRDRLTESGLKQPTASHSFSQSAKF